MESRKLIYTVNGGAFTPEQRKFYEENGYIVFPKLVSDEDLEICRRRFLDICDGKVDTPLIVMRDRVLKQKGEKRGEYLVNKIQDFMHDNVFFDHYISNEDVIKIVRSIIGPDVCAIHSMLINKPPDSSELYSKHPLHQDLQYFPIRPDHMLVASWTAMERVDEKNGCLFVIPGSHKGPFYPHSYLDGEMKLAYYGVRGFDKVPKVNLLMEKGDTVFFHPLLLHGSGPNLTKGFRKAISTHYASNHCNLIDVTGTSQEIAKTEVEDLTARKGAILEFREIWQAKSRHVCGVPGNIQSFKSKL